MLTQVSRRFLLKNVNLIGNRSIHTTAVNTTFWEREKKAGYAKKYPLITKQFVLDGLKDLKKEIKLWSSEVKEKFEGDPIMCYRPGEIDMAWKFSGLLRDSSCDS